MLRSTISVVGIVLAGAIFFLYTQPEFDSTKLIQAKINQYNQALEKAQELQKLKQQLIARYNSFNPNDIDRLHKLLPDHVDNVRLILDMDNMATRRGMGLKNVDVSGTSKTDAAPRSVIGTLGDSSKKYESLNVGFSTTGTYDDFKLFLGDLESSLRIVDLQTLSLAPAGARTVGVSANPGEQVFNFNINLKTYWLK